MSLTKRQTQIVCLLAQGHTAEQCAEKMHRSTGTVRRHIILACERVNARNTTHLVAIALTEKMIQLAVVMALLITAVAPDTEALRHRPPSRTRTQVSASRTVSRRDTGAIYL